MPEWSPLPLTISEAVFQDTLMEAMQLLRWHVVHFRPARVGRDDRYVTAIKGMPGSPDLLAAREGRVLMIELKRHGAKPRPEQRSWLTALGEYGRLWTPVDWNDGTIWGDIK